MPRSWALVGRGFCFQFSLASIDSERFRLAINSVTMRPIIRKSSKMRMDIITDRALGPIAEKVLGGQRLSGADGMILEGTSDLHGLGALADHVRRARHGSKAYYIDNRHINPTNICVNRCRFCAFRRSESDPDAYSMSLEDVLSKARQWSGERFSEFHIVGGLHPDHGYEYYRAMIGGLSAEWPDVHLQAFTAVEIAWFANLTGWSYEEVLADLKSVGLGSLPGGGAEIFNETIRAKICPDPDKIDSDGWIAVHQAAHRVGLKSNATMLYGHIESPADRIDHLIRLRSAQDQSGGFMTFIPLAFHPLNTEYSSRGYTSGALDLKMISISRLMLDNFDHIKAFWIMIGEKMAQLSLLYGADDIDGAVVEEKITQAAGGRAGQRIAIERLEALIREAGLEPVERDTVYNTIEPVESLS